MSKTSKLERETHYVGVGESVTVTNKYLRSIGTGSASTNEKKECASNNLFNFADSCNNSSNAQPLGLWGTGSGGGRPDLKKQSQAGDASSDNIVGSLRRLQTENSQGRAAQRYASVDQEEFESNISLSSYLSEANLNN